MTIRVEKATSDALWPLRAATPHQAQVLSRVRSVIPHVAGVAKVFHAIYERPGVTNHGSTWNDERDSTLMKDPALSQTLQHATLAYSSPGAGEEVGRRVRWKKVVESAGLNWHPEVNANTVARAHNGSWPANLWGPEEGTLDEEQLRALLRILNDAGVATPAVAAHPCFRCEPIESWRWHFGMGEFLAVRNHPINAYGDGPDSVMAVDGSWYILQDIDLPFTLVSASETVIRAILEEPTLEAVRASPDDRVDFNADTINWPRDQLPSSPSVEVVVSRFSRSNRKV